jgi:hypothetical protein
MLRLAYLAAIGAVLMATPTQAAEPTSSDGVDDVHIVGRRGDSSTDVRMVARVSDPDEIVCRLMPPPLGSRIGAGKVCATRRAWDARYKRDRELLEDAQGRKSRGPVGWW